MVIIDTVLDLCDGCDFVPVTGDGCCGFSFLIVFGAAGAFELGGVWYVFIAGFGPVGGGGGCGDLCNLPVDDDDFGNGDGVFVTEDIVCWSFVDFVNLLPSLFLLNVVVVVVEDDDKEEEEEEE